MANCLVVARAAPKEGSKVVNWAASLVQLQVVKKVEMSVALWGLSKDGLLADHWAGSRAAKKADLRVWHWADTKVGCSVETKEMPTAEQMVGMWVVRSADSMGAGLAGWMARC